MKDGRAKRGRQRANPKGIFCLEGDWWGHVTRKASVEPVLEVLHQWDPYYVPFVHRDVATRSEFEYYIKKWVQRASIKFPILHLAFHGGPGEVSFGDARVSSNVVSLEELAYLLENKCHKRIIHFGSCDTLDVHGHAINRFLRTTRALAVCGYRGSVDWLQACAFELIVFSGLQHNKLTISGARAMKRRIKASTPELCRKLDFHMVVRPS